MSKPSGNRVSVEAWNVKTKVTEDNPSGRKNVAKVAVRDSAGRFLGATNYKGSFLN